MRQAIVTKYLGPTNHRPSRVRATAAPYSITISWDHNLFVNANHTAVARALAEKLNWGGAWFGGALPSGEGNCYVNVSYPGARMTQLDDDDSFYVKDKELTMVGASYSTIQGVSHDD